MSAPSAALARSIGERAADTIRFLADENRRLRDELAAVVIRPIPENDVPGAEVWRALMEDLRDEGKVCLHVRHQEIISIDWWDLSGGSPPTSAE